MTEGGAPTAVLPSPYSRCGTHTDTLMNEQMNEEMNTYISNIHLSLF